jgi:hypothetical protein
MNELHPLDVAPDVADRIRRRARAELAAHTDRRAWTRLERAAVRWIETPLVGVFASALLVWAAASVWGPLTL